MDTYKFHVAGVQHHQLDQVLGNIDILDELELIPEPTNKFDKYAIRIEYDGIMLGYVPKKYSAEISDLLESETPIICEIVKLDPSRPPWERLEVEIRSDIVDLDEDYLEDDYA